MIILICLFNCNKGSWKGAFWSIFSYCCNSFTIVSFNLILVIVFRFYEWKKDGSKKQPYYIYFRDGRPLVFAALFDSWKNLEGILGPMDIYIFFSPSIVICKFLCLLSALLQMSCLFFYWLISSKRIGDPFFCEVLCFFCRTYWYSNLYLKKILIFFSFVFHLFRIYVETFERNGKNFLV